jgi:hypothetical protein
MSPWKSGCFSAFERGDILKNSAILQLKKMGPFADDVYTSKLSVPEIIRRAVLEERSPFFYLSSFGVNKQKSPCVAEGEEKARYPQGLDD